jgi:DNA-binding CsgD family transcriptional regulator
MQRKLLRVVGAIYGTTTSAEAWNEVGHSLQQLLRSNACGIAVYNFRSRQGFIHFGSGYSAKSMRAYQCKYAALDVWLRNEEWYRVPGAVQTGRELVPEPELLRSEFYHDWLAPQDLFHRVSAVLMREGDNLCYFSMLRSRQVEPFDADETRVCAILAPHLRRTVQLRSRLVVLEEERRAMLDVLNLLSTPIILCDGDGVPVIVNEAGRQTLAAGDGLRLQGGKLSADRQAQTDQLLRMIGGAALAIRGEHSDVGATLSLARSSGGRPLSLLVSPLRAPPDLPGLRRIAAAVFVNDFEATIDITEERLSRLYGLTRSESRLAAKLAEGRSLAEAASSLNITTETARSYVKQVFSKTGARRQAELVRLLLVGPCS